MKQRFMVGAMAAVLMMLSMATFAYGQSANLTGSGRWHVRTSLERRC